jgi:Mg2+-importing ATPase
LFFVICPRITGGSYNSLDPLGKELFAVLFHTGWFVESLWSQTMVIHMIRTPKIPFIHSRASAQVALFTTLGIATGTIIPYTGFAKHLAMASLPLYYFAYLGGIILLYMLLATVMKKVFVWKYGELL